MLAPQAVLQQFVIIIACVAGGMVCARKVLEQRSCEDVRRIGLGGEALKCREVIRRSLLSAKLRESGGIAAETLA